MSGKDVSDWARAAAERAREEGSRMMMGALCDQCNFLIFPNDLPPQQRPWPDVRICNCPGVFVSASDVEQALFGSTGNDIPEVSDLKQLVHHSREKAD